MLPGMIRLALILALLQSSCIDPGLTRPGASRPIVQSTPLVGEGRRALFVGNSYLYTQNIPGIVQALADSAGGDRIAVSMIAGPDMALIDHWNAGEAQRSIRGGSWEWVVLQQGPSSLELNRDTLRLATGLFAGVMHEIGATPVLFSAWPSQARMQDFPRAIESYRIAAQDVSGIFAPVAGAWLATWERNPGASLYADGLHPTEAGAYVAALVIYARLLGKSPKGLPSTLRVRGGAVIAIDPTLAIILQDAAEAALKP